MAILQNSEKIPVLTYHSIDKSDSVISESPSNFEKQLSYLKKNGFKTMSLRETIRYIETGKRFPVKSIVITFDDGFKNNYTQAFPLLEQFGFTATVFLTTGHCGKTNNWSNQHPSIPQLAMLSWEEIREMSRSGIEFGAHTQSHPDLTKVSFDTARKEIIESKKELETRIDQPVELLSYPYGSYNKKIKEIAMENFKGAISNIPGKISPKSDMFALERINATGQIYKALPLKVLFIGSLDFYLLIKRTINKFMKFKKERYFH